MRVKASIVVPTFNRAAILERTLSALVEQDGASRVEVLVVDDGSTDETAEVVARFQSSAGIPLHYFFQPNRKQGAARNLGARHAAGDWLFFLGDDIVPSPGFLKAHLAVHESDPDPETSRTSVIGYTTWPPEFRRTRFLDYIGEQGWQFGYSLIEDPEDVPFNFLYTSNLSLSRWRFLEAGGFDEDFQEYGWEDIELSLRLRRLGTRIAYAPDARAYHYHHLTIRHFIERQRKVGYSAWNFYRKHPEMAGFLGTEKIPEYSRFDHLKMKALLSLCRLFEYRSTPDFSHYYPDLLTYHYILGMIEARRREAGR